MASFSDDFNRANSTDLGPGWVEVSGDWSIVSSQLSSGSAGGTIILRAASPMASSDHSVQVTIAATAAVSHGVWCRGNANISQGYLWRNDGSSWDLFSVVGGSFTVIGSYAVPAAPGDVAKVQAVGSTIKGFVNGVERVSVTDTNVPTGTSVGIRAESVASLRFDNFAAADVTAGTALTPAGSTEAAQPLTGSKTATLTPAVAVETVQAVAGGKTGALATAAEAVAVQAPAGFKTVSLTGAVQTEAAQPLTVVAGRTLAAATVVEEARPLAGVKTVALGPAAETAAAKPLTQAGTGTDVDITVGAPYSGPYTAGPLQPGQWEVGAPW